MVKGTKRRHESKRKGRRKEKGQPINGVNVAALMINAKTVSGYRPKNVVGEGSKSRVPEAFISR
jgi:hypothetical protein